MHNILRIYGVSHRTFNGHKHLQVYLGRVEAHRAAGRRWIRCVVVFFFHFSGLDVNTAAAAQTTSSGFPLESFVVAKKNLLCYIMGFLHECT